MDELSDFGVLWPLCVFRTLEQFSGLSTQYDSSPIPPCGIRSGRPWKHLLSENPSTNMSNRFHNLYVIFCMILISHRRIRGSSCSRITWKTGEIIFVISVMLDYRNCLVFVVSQKFVDLSETGSHPIPSVISSQLGKRLSAAPDKPVKWNVCVVHPDT